MQQTGLLYLGEMVNVFRQGTFKSSQLETGAPFSNPVLYGTADGGLGVIAQLPEGVFQ